MLRRENLRVVGLGCKGLGLEAGCDGRVETERL